jgi:chromosome partitioning protein
MAGHNVWHIDGNFQPSSFDSMRVRKHQGIAAPIAFDHIPLPSDLVHAVKSQASIFDDVVIDCGGFDSATMREAMLLADVIVIPFRTKGYDSWALKQMADLCAKAQAMRPHVRIMAFLNETKPGFRPAENKRAADALAQYPAIPYVDAPIVKRDAFPDSSLVGLSVFETKPADPKAGLELARLLKLIFGE